MKDYWEAKLNDGAVIATMQDSLDDCISAARNWVGHNLPGVTATVDFVMTDGNDSFEHTVRTITGR
jgi:hypothetical protein